ncbi:MAG: nucleotidyltransferase domain-containing protein [Candidatus Aminicenantales bacterium]
MKLKDFLKNFVGDLNVKLILYGSKARSDYHHQSDIDIAIIIKGLTKEQKRLILDKVAELEFTYLVPLSVLVLSEEDFNRLKKRERRIALDIEMEGISL